VDTAELAAIPAPAPAPVRLFNRNFFLLWQGQTVSQVGNQALVVAVMFWTMEVTGSASLMGLLTGLTTLPAVLLAPIGGTLADRYPRIRILITCDLISGLTFLVLTGIFVTGFDPHVKLAALFVVSVLNSSVRAFFGPAVAASIPDLVFPEKLASANSVSQLSASITGFIGQGVGGVLFRFLGPTLLFLIDGLSFFYAAVSSMFIDLPHKAAASVLTAVGAAAAAKPSWRQVLAGFFKQTGEGLRYTWGRQGLRNFVLVAALINFFIAPVLVLLPFYVTDLLKADSKWYGFLLGAISAGTVLGFLLAGVLKLQGETRGRALVVGLATGPSILGCLGFIHHPVAALATAVLGGAVIGLVNIYLITLIQLSTPAELRGRVLGLLSTLAGGLLPLGAALGGVLGDLTGKNIPLVYGVCGGLCTLVSLLLATRKECRAFLAG
jgi:DHA3 family macrolide efflux protein-like MFS transporter